MSGRIHDTKIDCLATMLNEFARIISSRTALAGAMTEKEFLEGPESQRIAPVLIKAPEGFDRGLGLNQAVVGAMRPCDRLAYEVAYRQAFAVVQDNAYFLEMTALPRDPAGDTALKTQQDFFYQELHAAMQHLVFSDLYDQMQPAASEDTSFKPDITVFNNGHSDALIAQLQQFDALEALRKQSSRNGSVELAGQRRDRMTFRAAKQAVADLVAVGEASLENLGNPEVFPQAKAVISAMEAEVEQLTQGKDVLAVMMTVRHVTSALVVVKNVLSQYPSQENAQSCFDMASTFAKFSKAEQAGLGAALLGAAPVVLGGAAAFFTGGMALPVLAAMFGLGAGGAVFGKKVLEKDAIQRNFEALGKVVQEAAERRDLADFEDLSSPIVQPVAQEAAKTSVRALIDAAFEKLDQDYEMTMNS